MPQTGTFLVQMHNKRSYLMCVCVCVCVCVCACVRARARVRARVRACVLADED